MKSYANIIKQNTKRYLLCIAGPVYVLHFLQLDLMYITGPAYELHSLQ